jgi:phosphate acetyltransferase
VGRLVDLDTLLGTKLPGPGTIYLGQTLRFRCPVTVGDTVTVSVEACEREFEHHRIWFDCLCVNQRREVVIEGRAEVIAPTAKVRRLRVALPEVHLHERAALFRALISQAGTFASLRMAVVHPVDRDSLLGAIERRRLD